MSHTIDLLNHGIRTYSSLYPVIVQVGAGGTGGALVQQIAQLLSSTNVTGSYLIADPDVVEEKNLNNQLFLARDVGKCKASVLANRYRAAYNLQIASYTKGYIEDKDTLLSLFTTDYHNLGGGYSNRLILPILIGAVDNNYTRQIMNQLFGEVNRMILIDAGNGSSSVPKDFPRRPMSEWTMEEKNIYNATGWDGQVVCGVKLEEKTLLPPVGEVFPEMMEDKDEIAPSEVACSNIASHDRQRIMTNRMATLTLGCYLSEILENQTVSKHITFFNAKEGSMQSVQYKEN
ncbi:ThiF family adenylyltransferase [Anaerobacillus sp. 1_MG-2023]|uniref:ThiF family adenylyltransferase n=1 Tax=Anaerobacillus sp. 1_MG-2023 TaxID=3062655 RepID=UPI0026E27C59|nr:ThiF family adenylyltransferase [Anaerobacillus sp. 1_MG-2023]MDO6657397.1 ThiF family adenylyltransferase [Anaerobacillus sp. 1_MG-2023]